MYLSYFSEAFRLFKMGIDTQTFVCKGYLWSIDRQNSQITYLYKYLFPYTNISSNYFTLSLVSPWCYDALSSLYLVAKSHSSTSERGCLACLMCHGDIQESCPGHPSGLFAMYCTENRTVQYMLDIPDLPVCTQCNKNKTCIRSMHIGQASLYLPNSYLNFHIPHYWLWYIYII